MTTADAGPARGSGMAFAYVACGLALVAGAVWTMLGFTDLGGARLARLDLVPFGARMLFSLVCVLAGAFVLAHPSGGAVGRLLLVGAAELVGHGASAAVAALGTGGPARTVVVLVALLGDVLYTYLLYGLPFWLPDGRLPGRWWGRALAMVIALWTLGEVWMDDASRDHWYGMDDPLAGSPWAAFTERLGSVLSVPLELVPVGLTLLGCVVMTVRWRRGRRRAETGPSPAGLLGRPLVPLFLLMPFLLWMAAGYAGYYLPLGGDLSLAVYYVPVLLWPLGLGLVFVRDRSAHLDRATRRVLVVLVSLVVLLLTFVGLALALSRVLPGSRTPGALVLAAASLVLGLLLRAGAGRAVRVVDQFYYGERAQPYQVVRDLAGRLSRTVNPADAPRLLCTSVVDTLRFPAARVLVETSEGSREAAVLGTASGPLWHRFPLTYEGAHIGSLEAAARAGEAVLDQQDAEVLFFLADQSAPAIAALRLYEELQAGRERIVLAREEARRQLRRDLHDGIAPSLSGLRLQLDAARAALPGDHPSDRPLSGVSQGIADSIVELRRITEGLAPAVLDRESLSRALEQLAGQLTSPRLCVSADLDPDPLPVLPVGLEVALYRIAAEGLHNVVRHAEARHAWLRLCVRDGSARVEISDDGGGFGQGPGGRGTEGRATGGVGLRSMAERAEELGGTLVVSGRDGPRGTAGVVVRAVIPIPGHG
ncbi:histidine kinase [Streptacidiphilus sp. EB129]|uniref:sensor histidine kinase n=1 Tax=Streptacidiphilus sp. EB129 TaxID=3156262 RepID=UPI0035154E2D